MRKNIIFMMASLMGLTACFDKGHDHEQKNENEQKNVKIGVVANDDNNTYFFQTTNHVFKNTSAFESRKHVSIELEHASGSLDKQKEIIAQLIQQGAQALIVHPATFKNDEMKSLVNLACQRGVPAVYFYRNPGEKLISSCSSAYFVGVDDMQVGIKQGLQILNGYGRHPAWDKNGDGEIQYAIVNIDANSLLSQERGERLKQTLQYYPELGRGIQEVFSGEAGYSVQRAEQLLDEWVKNPRFREVEVIVANDDLLALGAYNALQKHGLTVPVFGAGGIPEVTALMRQGKDVYTFDTMLDEVAGVAIDLANNLAQPRPPQTELHYSLENRMLFVPPYDMDEAEKRRKFRREYSQHSQHSH